MNKHCRPIFLMTAAGTMFVLVTLMPLNDSWAAGESQDQKKYLSKEELKSNRNLQFNTPDDWPIEERDGAIRPIPIEEYLELKFKSIDSRFEKFEAQITELHASLKKMETQSQKLNQSQNEPEEPLV